MLPSKQKPQISSDLEKLALICTVENYSDGGLETVIYADKDGAEIRKALLNLGYLDENIKVLTNEKATATTLAYELFEFAKHATKTQSFLFFFAGHGSTVDGKNYLLAHDSRPGNIAGTSVGLGEVLQRFEASECSRVMFFLDCCHSGVNWASGSRGVLESLAPEEFKAHLDEAEYRVVFSACDKDQKSYPSYAVGHGHWTYQLLCALRGQVPRVLNENGLLLSGPLQDFLRLEVAANVALETKSGPKRKQSPKIYGDSSGTFLVADLSQVLAQIKLENPAQPHVILDFTLNGRDQTGVKRLSGFHGTVLKYVSDATMKFVAKSADPDIDDEMTEIHAVIQKSKRYKSRELVYYPAEDSGKASISTPEFDYNICYEQDSEDYEQCNVTRELTGLNNPELLKLKWFNQVFERKFDCAVFEFSPEILVAKLIDDLEDEGIDVTPNARRTFFGMSLDGFNGTVVIKANSITYRFNKATTPDEMNQQLSGAHQSLLSISKIRSLIPLSDGGIQEI